MNSLFIAVVMQACLSAAESDDYVAAQREAEKGKPLVVLVGTEWCPPCQTMKNSVIPQVRKRGLLRRVAFAIVNPDRNKRLARQITGGTTSIPQLVMYRKTSDGWKRRKLVGGQSVENVESFINNGLAQDAKEKKSAKTRDGRQSDPGQNRRGSLASTPSSK